MIKVEHPEDPEVQAVVQPENGRWKLVVDKDGYPHLYLEVKVVDDGELVKGLVCVDDLLPEGLSIRALQDEGAFDELSSEALAEATESRR